jgi:Flp pilus assembly protein CpaB
MTMRTYLIVGLALVFGLTSAMGINVFLKTRAANVEREMVQIAVGGDKGHPRLVPLGQFDIKWKHVPKDAIPPGALLATEDVVDRLPRIDIAKGEHITDNMLTAKGAKGIAGAIPPGKVSFAIRNAIVPSNVQPGNRVDVQLSYKQKDGGFKTATVLTMVDVFTVDGLAEPVVGPKKEAKEAKSVDLLLTPDQADELELGQKQGTLRLNLRNSTDPPAQVTRVADLKIEPVDADAGQSQGPKRIREIRGAEQTLQDLNGAQIASPQGK